MGDPGGSMRISLIASMRMGCGQDSNPPKLATDPCGAISGQVELCPERTPSGVGTNIWRLYFRVAATPLAAVSIMLGLPSSCLRVKDRLAAAVPAAPISTAPSGSATLSSTGSPKLSPLLL